MVFEGSTRSGSGGSTIRRVFNQIHRAFLVFHGVSIAYQNSECQNVQAPQGGLGMYRILLVEDDDAVRTLLRSVLRMHYEVIEARSGDIAVSLVESTVGTIHLVITDVVMPRMGGYELVRWVRCFNPGTKVIYISGYLDSDVVEQTRGDPNAVFLQKPFLPAEILRAVRDALGEQANRTGG